MNTDGNKHFYNEANAILADLDHSNPLSVSIYDTIQAASIQEHIPEYAPNVKKILQDSQHLDGSWGSNFFLLEDRLINTLSAIKFFRNFYEAESQEVLRRAEDFCKNSVPQLRLNVRMTVAAEALIPKLWKEAFSGDENPPSLLIFQQYFNKKLSLVKLSSVFKKPTPLIHTLEVFELEDHLDDVRDLLHVSGNMGNSPAATIWYYQSTKNITSLEYLKELWGKYNGAFPVNCPIEIFELNWVLYFFSIVDPEFIKSQQEKISRLGMSWSDAVGIAWSDSFPVPDLDDTAMTFIHFRVYGLQPDVAVFRSFLYGDQILCFPGETHKAVTHIAHLVEALYIAETKDNHLINIAMIDILNQQVSPGVWLDKWHVSPYYATSQVMLSCANVLSRDIVKNSIDWFVSSQNFDGGWGEEKSTVEESSYAVLTLFKLQSIFEIHSIDRIFASARSFLQNADSHYQEMWIDKNLYCPINVVKAARLAAEAVLGLR